MPLNDVETLASSSDDFVSYYSGALQGAFFTHAETLQEFRRILSTGDAIWLLPLPLGSERVRQGRQHRRAGLSLRVACPAAVLQ